MEKNGGTVSEEEKQSVGMAECGACRAVIPIDSEECPECGTQFSGVSEDELGECGACNALVPLDSTRCPSCSVLFVADDVVDILRQWIAETGINIRKLFEKFDENNDGTIDSSELKRGLLSLNLADLPPTQVDRLVAQIDEDENGVIDLDEFDAILTGTDETDTPVDQPDNVVDDVPVAEEAQTDVVVEAKESEDEASVEEPVDDEVEESLEEKLVDTEALDTEDVEDGIDDEDFDLEDVDDAEPPVEKGASEDRHNHPLAALAELMEEHDVSAQRMFNDLDVDGNGMISLAELNALLEAEYSDALNIEDVQSIMDGVDGDGDGMIDITEFIESIEELETLETLVEEMVFPTRMQERMMSKSWNDSVWPVLHVFFGIVVAVFIANGMFGFVDGSGGNIAYEPNDSGLIPSGDVQAGDIYPCDEKFQMDGCRNSLTPLAGANGSLSMPMGFYWDGIALIVLGFIGLSTTLFLHFVKAPEWRARVRALKEFVDDKSDATADSEEAEETDDESEDDVVVDDDDIEEEGDGGIEDDEDTDGEDDDSIDIGSHIGLTFEDEEVFGTIIEFDDDEGTVTIEEDGTGDLVTGYQEDMFIE
ncbi:MAG: hypothetical protein CMB34_03200 [Euryarchaeota archaeon]|nr:hypothetical protein [Euryarchaeota archaeon]